MGTNADELRMEIEQTREDMGQTLGVIGEKVTPSRIVERRKRRMAERARRFKDRVMGSAHHATDSMSETSHEAMDTVKEMPAMVRERTEGAPMVAGAVAFGAGMLIAAVIPPTRMERERAEQVKGMVEPLKEEVTTEAREMADHLKEPAKQAARQVGESVKGHDQGASPSGSGFPAPGTTAATGSGVSTGMSGIDIAPEIPPKIV